MSVLWAGLLILVLLAGWSLNLFGLPGNWLNVVAIALYAWLVPAESRWSIGWAVVVAVGLVALIGELIEAAAGALGVSKVGGSRRGALLAMVGAMAGGLLGALLGSPIPVVGSIVGILLLASLGALAGAMIGERWKGRGWAISWKVGRAAFWGRLLGTLGKILTASIIVAIAVGALLVA